MAAGPPTIGRDEARRFYDRFGARQDRQGFYEDAALDRLIALGRFADAGAVFEFGCGTGRLAERLLSDHLPRSARYVGIDLSPVMVGLARNRLDRFGERCRIHPSDGGFDFSSYGGPFDRFVTTYVLDLLNAEDIARVFAGTHAAMGSGGIFCHAGLTVGNGPVSWTTSLAWSLVHRVRPLLVGGCRPIVLSEHVPSTGWRLVHREVVVSTGIASEVVIVERR